MFQFEKNYKNLICGKMFEFKKKSVKHLICGENFLIRKKRSKNNLIRKKIFEFEKNL